MFQLGNLSNKSATGDKGQIRITKKILEEKTDPVSLRSLLLLPKLPLANEEQPNVVGKLQLCVCVFYVTRSYSIDI